MNENEKMILKLSEDVAIIKAIVTGDLTTMKDDIKEIQSELKQQSEKTSEISALRDRVANLESSHVWFIRTIMGLVLTGVVGVILVIK